MDIIYRINMELCSEQSSEQSSNLPNSVNLITIFNNITDNTIMKVNIVEELAHERNDIIMTNINSIVKVNEGKLNKDELYDKVKTNIKTFEVTLELYLIALNKMHEKEYIDITANPIKIVW